MTLGGVPREQKMLKGHLTRVIYHQVYEYTKIAQFHDTRLHLLQVALHLGLWYISYHQQCYQSLDGKPNYLLTTFA